MSQEEANWKTLKRLHPIALDRFCEIILAEIANIDSDANRSPHQRYLAIYKLIERRDKEITRAFDDMRRSRIFERLINIYALDLLTDVEFSQFGESLRQTVTSVLTPAERKPPTSGTNRKRGPSA
jgi:hypothetical protein